MQKYDNGKLMPFLMIDAVKRKRYRRSENKKQIFCNNSKKQCGFDDFKTKADSWANVKEIDFLTEIY